MTLNFVDIEDLRQSAENLRKVESIRELYLTGNGCESWPGFKEYIIATVPQITFLDGNEILKSERIKALQNLEFLKKDLERTSIENIFMKENDPDKDNPNKYTKEYRRKLYKEIEEEKLKKEEDKKKQDKPYGMDELNKDPPSVYKDNGEIRICNQGKYDFFIDQDIFKTGMTTFELKIPKFLDTSQVLVDLNPQYIRVEVKGKVTQLKFDQEIIVEKSTIQRSTTTGYLLILAPIMGFVSKDRYKDELANMKKNTQNISTLNKKNNSFLKKELKPLKESVNSVGNKVNQIDIVENIESKFPKNVRKEDKIDIEIDKDINLDEIPDLD